jgi:hypothetical protein
MRRTALTIMLAAGNLHAQTLYECAGRTGHAYQQTPCTKTMRQVRTMETIPEPAPTPAQRAERAQRLAQDRAESAFLSHLAGTDRGPSGVNFRNARSGRRETARSEDRDECSAAKASRKRVLRAVGLDRTMELLSRLDAEVAEACGD